ncbi:LysR family transcriptional regulator [Bordetella genomosp. 11]|uniref:LysR family transcriptional regulator n=1 Tax=Bordetella genomosp. 11 TaxID=1416808 RepID=A0A261UZH8_9BORD|nr:LysR family transcriptional regulator [Bordetella genomosp. 11]OZI67296.1 LysR family transcriptional regulator [Bordetella genomosp. 11]
MELRHLRAFVVAARELHFARAAEMLGVSSSTLTLQVQELERALQARLFNRTKRSVALTPAGEAFLAETVAVLERYDRAVNVGRRAGRGQVGRVELGHVGSAAFTGVLQDQMRRFRAAWPDVMLNASELPMDQLPGRLEAGTVDIGFVRLPVSLPAAIASHVLVRDDFCLALPSGHRLAGDGRPGGDPIRARDLAKEAFIVPEQDLGLREVARRGRFAPRIAAVPGSLLSVLTHVSLGAGVAILPSVVKRVIALPDVVFRQVAGPGIPSSIAALYRRHERSPAVRHFIEQIRNTEPLLID